MFRFSLTNDVGVDVEIREQNQEGDHIANICICHPARKIAVEIQRSYTVAHNKTELNLYRKEKNNNGLVYAFMAISIISAKSTLL